MREEMEENDVKKLVVALEDGGEIKINRPRFCSETMEWIFIHDRTYSIVEYEPVRLKILE